MFIMFADVPSTSMMYIHILIYTVFHGVSFFLCFSLHFVSCEAGTVQKHAFCFSVVWRCLEGPLFKGGFTVTGTNIINPKQTH